MAEKVKIVSVCENRISPLLVNVLILACLPVIGDLSKVPTAVICDGLFLVMGISGLPGNELFERVKLIFIEPALYPPMHFSEKQVPRSRMHLFTLFQLSFVVILYVVARSPIALAFPVFLVTSIPARMLLSKFSGGYISQDMVDLLDHKRKSEEVEASGVKAKVSAEVEESDDKEKQDKEKQGVVCTEFGA